MVAEGMEKPGEQTVLRRKARAARVAHEARAMSPERALRVALERCASGDLGFMLSVTGVETRQEPSETLAADLPDPALILLLDGPDGVPGAMVLDLQMTAALVEAQTMGRVSNRPAALRAPTRTDAAIAVPLVDGVFARLVSLLDGEGAGVAVYRYGAMIEDGRTLTLALGTGEYRLMRASIELGPDRAGEAVIALPVPPAGPQAAGGGDARPRPEDSKQLRDSLLGAPARLEAVLCRLTLPLAQMRMLRVGDTVPLPAGVLRRTRLESAPNRLVARAVLGQMRGQRALRLYGVSGGKPVDPPEDAVADRAATVPEPPATARVDPAEGLASLENLEPEEPAGHDQPGQPGADIPAIGFAWPEGSG